MSRRGCGDDNGNNIDDDRLNLAEYQVFDESLFEHGNANKRAEYCDDTEDVMNSNKNPYRELTMKC